MAKNAEKYDTKMLFAIIAIAFLAASCMFVFASDAEQNISETAIENESVIQSEATTYAELAKEISGLENDSTIVLNHDCVSNDKNDKPITVENKEITIDLNGFAIDRNLSEPRPDGHVIFVT